MSSTRHAKEGSPYRDERYASSPILNHGINGGRVADRCATLTDRNAVELIWFIQYLSLMPAAPGRPAGLASIAEDLVNRFPASVGTERMQKQKSVATISGYEACMIKNEVSCNSINLYHPILESDYEKLELDFNELKSHCRDRAIDNIPLVLREACLNPEFAPKFVSKFFSQLEAAIIDYRDSMARTVDTDLVETSVTRQIADVFSYIFEHGGIGLIEGEPGLGKSWAARRLCDKVPGLMRYVRLPSAPDDRSFFAAIAEALGVAAGTNYSMNQIRARVDAMLRKSKIGLVIDEAQLLWSQVKQPKRTPLRIEWVLEMSDAGAPIVLVGLPEFSEWRSHYVAQTRWKDAQLERRLLRYQRLSVHLSTNDLFALAQHFWPQGGEKGWKLLVGFALGNNHLNASAIIQVLDSAKHRAKHDGRSQITTADVISALQGDHSSSSNRFTLSGISAFRNNLADLPQPNREAPQLPRSDYRTSDNKPALDRLCLSNFNQNGELTQSKGGNSG